MWPESPSTEPEPATLRPPVATFDDGRRACCLEGTGLALLVNIMRIGQHRGRPAFREDLDERMQAEVRLWARSLLADDDDPVAHEVKAFCVKMLEDLDEDGGL